MEKDKNLIRYVGIAHRFQSKILDELLKPYDLWHGQFFILKHILSNGTMCSKDICHNRHADKAAISRAVNKLVLNGYLEKKVDSLDKRKHFLIPTEKAKAISSKFKEYLGMAEQLAFKGFNSDERVLFLEFLERMVSNLKEGEIDAK